jgi:hypothetical protein
MDELLTIATKVEKVLALGETNTNKHLQALKEMFVNYFGRGIDIRMDLNLGRVSIVQCHLCKLEEHTTFACHKLVDLRPKCAKCGDGHKIEIVA